MIVIPASLRSDFIHMAGMTIHIALESTIHIVGIRSRVEKSFFDGPSEGRTVRVFRFTEVSIDGIGMRV